MGFLVLDPVESHVLAYLKNVMAIVVEYPL
jgi:hypothetical protein